MELLDIKRLFELLRPYLDKEFHILKEDISFKLKIYEEVKGHKSCVTQNQFESLKVNLEKEIKILNEKNEAKLNASKITPVDIYEEKRKKVQNLKEVFVSWSKRANINCYNKIFEYENIYVRVFWLR